MNLQKAWMVAWKDFKIFRNKRNIILSTVAFPLVVAVGIPSVLWLAGASAGKIPAGVLPGVLDSFSYLFVLGAAALPTAIASYSLAGEKMQKSLEPLLAAPVTDEEILLGKTISAFIPPIAAIYASSVVFMALVNLETYNALGYAYFPNLTIGFVLLVMAPLAALFCVEFNIITSSRVTDVRTVQQIGALTTAPFGAIYLASALGLLTLDGGSLLLLSVALAAVDVILYYVSRATFRRDEILTHWA